MKSNIPPSFRQDFLEEPGPVFGKGKTFMDVFTDDRHSDKREKNPYYPFTSCNEWELVSFLAKSNLSVAALDNFLKLGLVSSSEIILFVYLSISVDQADGFVVLFSQGSS